MSKIRFVLMMAIVTVVALLPGTVRAQDSTSPVTGILVVVPGIVEVGDKVEAVAIHVQPRLESVHIEYDDHFVLRGERCPGSGGMVEPDQWGLVARLKTCRVGEGVVRLVVSETGAVVAENTSTITERTSPPTRPSVEVFYDYRSQRLRLRDPVVVEVEFSEPVTGFYDSGITMVNGVAGGRLRDNGELYTYLVWATAIGDVVVSVGENVARSVRANLPNLSARTLVLGLPYDDNRDRAIDREELLNAVDDYLIIGNVTRDEVMDVVDLYLNGPIPERDRCPQFEEDDPHEDGLAPVRLRYQLEVDIENAIEEELSRPEVAALFMIDQEDEDPLTVLIDEVLGSNIISAVSLGDGLYQYGYLRANFEISGTEQMGLAKVWITESSSLRRCVPTRVTLGLPDG